jgi:hypothetical protein
MTARSLLLCVCVAAACRGTPTVTADQLIVTATVQPDTYSLARDSAPIRVTIVARNPEARPVDVDTHGDVRMPLGPYAAVVSDSAQISTGLSFGLRVVRSGESLLMRGVRAGDWTVHFDAGESKTDVMDLKRADILAHVRGGAPGTYLLIPSYVQHEARPLRLVVTP